MEACLKEVQCRLQLTLHPSQAGNARTGIQEELNDFIMRYNENYGGVVLSYSNIELESKKCKILDGMNPYVRVCLSATLLLFSPAVGSTLEGVVHKTGRDYIGIHVLGVFNAAIRGKELTEDFECDEDEWTNPSHFSRTDHTHKISVGSRIRFVVTGLRADLDNHIAIDAAVSIPGTGCIDWLEEMNGRSNRCIPKVRAVSKASKGSHKSTKVNERERIFESGTTLLAVKQKKKKMTMGDKSMGQTDDFVQQRSTKQQKQTNSKNQESQVPDITVGQHRLTGENGTVTRKKDRKHKLKNIKESPI